jgi:hypothetical protein
MFPTRRLLTPIFRITQSNTQRAYSTVKQKVAPSSHYIDPPTPGPIPTAKPTLSERMKDLYKKYGKVAITFHFAMWFATYGAMYLLVDQGVDVNKLLNMVGMGKKIDKDAPVVETLKQKLDPNANAFSWYWTTIKNSDAARKMVVAFALLKLTGPLRTLLTLSVTPALAKALARRGWIALVKP